MATSQALKADTRPTKSTSKGERFKFAGLAALTGVLAAAVLLAVAELLALIFARTASPIIAIGSFIIDIVPRPIKELAIELFGSADKIVLLGSVGLAAVIAAALAGLLQYFRPALGLVLLGVAGVLSVLALVTRAGAGPLDSIPTILGVVAAAVFLLVSTRLLRSWHDGHPAGPGDGRLDRRGFLRVTGITAAGAVVVGAGSRVVNSLTSNADALRADVALPAPGTTLEVPAGAELDVPGISPLFTPNSDFYRVDTALTIPTVDPNTWSLKVYGMVDQEFEITFKELLDMGLDEFGITLTCVSNQVGGNLLGNAKWLGVPVRELLARAGVQSGADMVLSRSADGYTASTPLSTLTDQNLDAIIAVAMNGEPLPPEHGFPVRMITPGIYGYVGATKWLTELKVTTFAADQAYWTPRGYDAEAPIKMSSRMDVPKSGDATMAGQVTLAGVAWAQPIGVKTVELQIDDADYVPANLSTPINNSTWVQWSYDWTATAGSHYVTVRATDHDGNVQISDRAPVAPNGSSGLQRTLVIVR